MNPTAPRKVYRRALRVRPTAVSSPPLQVVPIDPTADMPTVTYTEAQARALVDGFGALVGPDAAVAYRDTMPHIHRVARATVEPESVVVHFDEDEETARTLVMKRPIATIERDTRSIVWEVEVEELIDATTDDVEEDGGGRAPVLPVTEKAAPASEPSALASSSSDAPDRTQANDADEVRREYEPVRSDMPTRVQPLASPRAARLRSEMMTVFVRGSSPSTDASKPGKATSLLRMAGCLLVATVLALACALAFKRGPSEQVAPPVVSPAIPAQVAQRNPDAEVDGGGLYRILSPMLQSDGPALTPTRVGTETKTKATPARVGSVPRKRSPSSAPRMPGQPKAPDASEAVAAARSILASSGD